MNDRYGRDDRSDPRSRQGSRDNDWQDRDSRDYDHPRQQQQWHDESRSYGESINRNRGGNPSGGQMGGQQGSYGGGSQDFWNRDDGDDWSSTGSQGRSSAPRGGRQGSQRSMGSYGQSGFGTRDRDFSSFTGNDFGGRDFSGGHGAYGSSYSAGSGRGFAEQGFYGQSFGSRGDYAGGGDYGRSSGYRGGVGGREYMGPANAPDDRGFIERAGDTIANWFSDDDDDHARRGQSGHQMDHRGNHRGRGPSGYTRSDERIREDANDHLTHDPSVDASNITVSVEKGEITLSGTVNSRFAKRRAEDCVDHVSGVKHVQNNLRVEDRMSDSRSMSSGSTAGSAGTAMAGTGTSASGSTGTSATKSGTGSTAR